MKRTLITVGTLLILGCSNSTQIVNHESSGNLAATNPLSCIQATSVMPDRSAADITVGAKECAKQSRYDEAAELIMVASAYAYYDTQRVADKSAHSALNALFSKEFSSFSEAERKALFASVDTLNSGSEKKQEICSFLTSSEPPSYMPSYMIAHGMGAFTGSVKEPLVQGFNPEEGWSKALGFVKCRSS